MSLCGAFHCVRLVGGTALLSGKARGGDHGRTAAGPRAPLGRHSGKLGGELRPMGRVARHRQARLLVSTLDLVLSGHRQERETGYLVGFLSNLIFPGSDRLADPREVIDGIYLELHEAVARPCVTFFPPWISGSELGGGTRASKCQPCPKGSGECPRAQARRRCHHTRDQGWNLVGFL